MGEPAEIKRMQDSQKPIRHLQYAEYKVGDYAMVSRISKPSIISWVDRKERAISAKLQPRYSGPYLITGQRSPVVYTLQIDGREKYIHAVNMKPFSGKQTYTTPFIQIGFSKSEADHEVVEEPLLMSPDPALNEAARTQFRQKNLSAQREKSRRENMRLIKTQREEYMNQRFMDSELNDDWILEQYEDVQDDKDVIDYRAWLKEKEKRRIFLIDAERKAFEDMTEEERQYQLGMIEEHGITVEDMIDIKLAEQEDNWRDSLTQSLQTNDEYYDQDNDNDDEEQISNRAIARRS